MEGQKKTKLINSIAAKISLMTFAVVVLSVLVTIISALTASRKTVSAAYADGSGSHVGEQCRSSA